MSTPVETPPRGQPLQRPVLLSVGMILCGFAVVVFGLVLLMALAGVGSFTIDDEAVSASEFLSRAGILLASGAVLNGLIAYGLYAHQSWARPLMLVFWPVMYGAAALSSQQEGDAACAIVFGVIATGIAAWYLYGKKNVREYYAEIKRREG